MAKRNSTTLSALRLPNYIAIGILFGSTVNMTASEEKPTGIRRWERRRPTVHGNEFPLATVTICFPVLRTLFGKRLYAFDFFFFSFSWFLTSRHQGHLIIFLFCNIPHEKSRLFPWKTAQKRDWLSGLFYAPRFLLFSFYFLSFVGSLCSECGTAKSVAA